MTIQIFRRWLVSEKRILEAETEKANAELSFLKAQINPHFLFNTLNTIYTLILTQNDKAGDAVLKLSNIMRYATDDATANFVPLEKEVDSITDFIALQRLQHGKKAKLDFSVTGNLENKQIAPLILLTYIENAFKYGVSSHLETTITIKITVEADNITFFCQNSIFTRTGFKEARTGVGLENTKKRLEFLYPGKHDLKITCTEDLYTVNLNLNIAA
jgi:LytS/YehU family sensor histidine kinase